MDDNLFLEIPKILKEALQKQLRVPRQSKTYSGQKKQISGKYPTPKSPPIASGNLINNIDVFWKSDFDSGTPQLIVEMPKYWIWVDEGRRPGRYPPLSAIDRWSVVKKGMTGIRDEKGRFIPRRTLNFLRARSIAKYGFGGNDFIMKGYNSVQQQILELYGEEVAGFLQFQIDKFADNLR